MTTTTIASNIEWKKWGEEDPLYGVSSWSGKAKGDAAPWTDSEFYSLGKSDWEDALARWKQYGVNRASCLEIGCGTGRVTMHMARFFERVHAIDISEGMLAYARTHVDAPSVTFHLTNGATLPVPDQSVSAIFSSHVFQHFEPTSVAADYFAEIARVLTPGGTFMIHLPLYQWPAMPPVFNALYQLRKTVGNLRARIKRRLMVRGRSKPIMRMTHYAMADLFDTLPAYGFTGVEISVFPMKSNGDPHPFIFARKAGENGS